jgi:LysM repeat protein
MDKLQSWQVNLMQQYGVQVTSFNVDLSIQSEVKKKEYEVIKGDTMYSISKKFNISIEDLKSKNNISDNTISVGQILVLE